MDEVREPEMHAQTPAKVRTDEVGVGLGLGALEVAGMRRGRVRIGVRDHCFGGNAVERTARPERSGSACWGRRGKRRREAEHG